MFNWFNHKIEKYNHTEQTKHTIDPKKQWIHLYPGGGMASLGTGEGYNTKLYIITTQNYIYNQVSKLPVRILAQGYCPIFSFAESLDPAISITKNYMKSDKLTVCFTSLGNITSKGYFFYREVVKLAYKLIDPKKLRFLAVGFIPSDDMDHVIQKMGVLSQSKLSDLYRDEVDIYFNGDTGAEYQGWPLGSESIIGGCLMITTDPKNENTHYFNFKDDEIIIVNKNDFNKVVDWLKKLSDDKTLFKEYGSKLGNKI